MQKKSDLKRSYPSEFGLALTSGVAAVGLSALNWLRLDTSLFETRDDGIITLAHARMFASNGVVGVSAMGDRVLGTSSPLHFLLASAYYKTTGDKTYTTFANGLSFAAMALVGVLLLKLSASIASSSPARFALTVCSLVVLILCFPFFGWHFSSLENPLVTVLLLAAVLLAPVHPKTTRAFAWTLAALSLCRSEAPVLAAVLAGAATFGNVLTIRQRLVALGRTLLPTLVVQAALIAVCTWYFGSPLPTTVANRSRDGLAAASILMLVTCCSALWCFGVSLCRRLTIPGTLWRTFGIVGSLAVGYVSVASLAGSSSVASTIPAVTGSGALFALPLLIAAGVVPSIRPPRFPLFVGVLLWAAHYEFVFGPTRIHGSRVVSATLPVMLFASISIGAPICRRLVSRPRLAVVGSRFETLVVRAAVGFSSALLVIVMLLDFASISEARLAGTFYLGWQIEPKATYALDAAQSVVDRVDSRLVPIVASPDLGKLAFRGEAQIVDLLYIGDPLYQRLQVLGTPQEVARLRGYWLLKIMPPDVIILAGGATCELNEFRSSTEFAEAYEQLPPPPRTVLPEGNLGDIVRCRDGDLSSGIWQRDDQKLTSELELSASLIGKPGLLPEGFFSPCNRTAQLEECLVRVRAYRRAMPGVAGATSPALKSAVDSLGSGPVSSLAKALLSAPINGRWVSDAVAAFERLPGLPR